MPAVQPIVLRAFFAMMQKPKLAFNQLFFVSLLFVGLYWLTPDKSSMFSLDGMTMGTHYVIKSDNPELPQMAASIETLLTEFNQTFSTYLETSEISQWNSNLTTEPQLASEDFRELAKLAQFYCRASDGAYDVTIKDLIDAWGFGPTKPESTPSDDLIKAVRMRTGCDVYNIVDNERIQKTHPMVKLDLSSIAKGYAVDKIYDLLKTRGYVNFLIEIGGEVRVAGKPGISREFYKLGISRPNENSPATDIAEVLLLKDGESLATSGNYRNTRSKGNLKWAHIINPATGKPEQTDILSASIVASSCTSADALATMAMIKGSLIAPKILDQMNVEYLLISLDSTRQKLSSIQSSGLRLWNQETQATSDLTH